MIVAPMPLVVELSMSCWYQYGGIFHGAKGLALVAKVWAMKNAQGSLPTPEKRGKFVL